MDAPEDRFESLLKPIVELPDRDFGDVAETIIHTADVRYFDELNCSSDRACALRQKLVVGRWEWTVGLGTVAKENPGST